MRTLTRILLASSGAALAGLAPAVAGAQSDVTPHLPNVLLLLDSSGSMEYLIPPGTKGVPVLPGSPDAPSAGSTCALTGTLPTVHNRWTTLVEVLTGSFPNGVFGCETVQRNAAGFVTEYALPGTTYPYDYNYFLPWNRIYSNGCTMGAGNIGAGQNWGSFGPNALYPHTQGGSKCSWSGQNTDGILDIFGGLARFGVMTLDTLPDPSTGQSTPSNFDGPSALAGNWSYFHNWRSWANASPYSAPTALGTPNVPAAGEPINCSTGRYVEVGARNPAAPPWEGPLTGFGPWCTDTGVAANNDAIQNQILAMRPYGATPIAGLLDDAREFLFNDKDQLPGTGYDFGPYSDMYWANGCRKTFQILVTDGEPNLDLRGPTGQCDAAGPGTPMGTCPYDPAEKIISDLRLNPPSGLGTESVNTYVVGLAIDNPANLPAGKTSCAQLDFATDCQPPLNPTLSDCCTLQKLAQAGALDSDPVFTGTGGKAHAFFVNNAGDLKSALASILSSIIGAKTSRTAPVYAAAGPADSQGPALSPPGGNPALSYHFAATVNVNGASGATGQWTGNIQRERYACVGGVPTAQAVDPKLGDNYAANLNAGIATRLFFTAIGADAGGGVINSDWTIRPNIGSNDGFGTYGTQAVGGAALQPLSAFPTTMSNFPAAFGIAAVGDDPNCAADFGVHNAPGTCAADLVTWAIGGTNSLAAGFKPEVSRDPASAYCNQTNTNRNCGVLGAIYHSTPVVAGPPRAFLRDDTYVSYASDPVYSIAPIGLYTATIDGQLHAFKVSASVNTDKNTTDSLGNNEMWSFFPPAVLQHLDNNFNSGGANLLDGTPVIADIPGSSKLSDKTPLFERTSGGSAVVNWHRVLVASGGAAAAGGFYYALDITDPTKPSFLWQVATDGLGNRLFGKNPPPPAITSVAIIEGTARTQVPVAILAGGGGTVTSCSSAVASPKVTTIDANDAASNNPSNRTGTVFKLGSTTPPPLRCWTYSPRIDGTGCTGAGSGSAGGSGSGCVSGVSDGVITGATLTVVRLDTGAVIAHFMGQDGHGSTANRTGNLFVGEPFTAPLTGAPVAYPADIGQVAQKIYVGDADGQLWRLDVSNTDPTKWSVSLAWDSYIDNKNANRDGIQLPPVVSRDPLGNTVLIVATGEQNMLTAQSTDNRIWSLTETPLNYNTSQNWMMTYASNQGHVVGQMALFNDALYFSTYQPLGGTPTVGDNSGSGSGFASGSASGNGSPTSHVTCTAGAGNACGNGQANLAAVDYRRPATATGLPFGRWGTAGTIYAGASVNDGSVIFGVSTTELPSCGGSQTTSDPYFGSHTQVTNANTSEYRIMWQVGAGQGLTTGSGVRNEGVQGMQNMTIPPPGQSTRFDSWATIVE